MCACSRSVSDRRQRRRRKAGHTRRQARDGRNAKATGRRWRCVRRATGIGSACFARREQPLWPSHRGASAPWRCPTAAPLCGMTIAAWRWTQPATSRAAHGCDGTTTRT
eukprot:scaffold33388_cov122-Isochrysis_galbana.AAC.8